MITIKIVENVILETYFKPQVSFYKGHQLKTKKQKKKKQTSQTSAAQQGWPVFIAVLSLPNVGGMLAPKWS